MVGPLCRIELLYLPRVLVSCSVCVLYHSVGCRNIQPQQRLAGLNRNTAAGPAAGDDVNMAVMQRFYQTQDPDTAFPAAEGKNAMNHHFAAWAINHRDGEAVPIPCSVRKMLKHRKRKTLQWSLAEPACETFRSRDSMLLLLLLAMTGPCDDMYVQPSNLVSPPLGVVVVVSCLASVSLFLVAFRQEEQVPEVLGTMFLFSVLNRVVDV